ncbi:MAG TPA: hypothetical protein VD978_30690 [Azospirillum sp.]|nr:hypothetical protein [Azospirillum sp.]
MTDTSPLARTTPAPRHRPQAVGAHPVPSRAPEWPRLTQREVRQIVLDILG